MCRFNRERQNAEIISRDAQASGFSQDRGARQLAPIGYVGPVGSRRSAKQLTLPAAPANACFPFSSQFGKIRKFVTASHDK
jgi:hypothetical protein